MGSDLFRVTKPGWVRIVNPEPFKVLGKTYRYGDVLLIRPGGTIRILYHSRPRSLAHYEAPNPPNDRVDCPSDAMLFDTPDDLRLMAIGVVGYEAQAEPDINGGFHSAPSTPPCQILPGHQARVPVSRMVRAIPAPIVIPRKRGGPYREETETMTLQPQSSWNWLRPGGVLTVLEERRSHVRVAYDPVPWDFGDQCEKDSWFWFPSVDFIMMEIKFQTYRTLEGLEQTEIKRIMRSSG